MRSKINILIPTYNRASLIGTTIENCLRQEYDNFDIIIYDDGSTDNTANIVMSYIKNMDVSRKNKIRYIRGGKNMGIGHARNILLNNIDGEYGIWLDSDDVMAYNRLSLCENYLKSNPHIDIVYSQIDRFILVNNELQRNNEIITADIKKYDKNNWDSLKYNTTCATACFKKELQKYKFDSELTMGGEDVLWLWTLINNDVQIGYISAPLYFYRRHSDRISNNKRKQEYIDIKKAEEIILHDKIINVKKYE